MFHDPRDWALDIQIVVDLLLSEQGVLGTVSSKNGNPNLPNHGWQEDGQPVLYFSNPDLWWASDYHLNRLGQGGFRHALMGVLAAIRGSTSHKDKPRTRRALIGKPSTATYNFAEDRLTAHRRTLLGQAPASETGLRTVYMVGGIGSRWNTVAGHANVKQTTQSQTLLARIGIGVRQERHGTPFLSRRESTDLEFQLMSPRLLYQTSLQP